MQSDNGGNVPHPKKIMRKNKFISFEGIDGAGKSTHLEALTERLRTTLSHNNQQLVVTREPGGTPLGEALRTLLLQHPMHLETEALLMFAARREHIAQVIEPALARGDWVLTDRFTDATFAYQGGGRGLARSQLEILETWVQEGLQPDLTVLFDIPTQTARARLTKVRTPDKFEAQPSDFFERTRAEYLRRAQAEPNRFIIINAALSIEAVHEEIEHKVLPRCFA